MQRTLLIKVTVVSIDFLNFFLDTAHCLDGYTYKWTNKKDRIRPGLNIFDAKGNELEWDYEHDTRSVEFPYYLVFLETV